MIRTFRGISPRIHPGAFVHDSTEIIGDVRLADRVSVWPFCVLRADVDRIEVGERTNIQDLTAIHCRKGYPTVLGRGVTVGHRVVLHGPRIGDGCLIGMGSIVMEAKIGPRCLIAAGSLVVGGMNIPARSLVMGSPARVIRKLNARELRDLVHGEKSYLRLMRLHQRTCKPLVTSPPRRRGSRIFLDSRPRQRHPRTAVPE